MNINRWSLGVLVAVLAGGATATGTANAQPNPARELAGLWEAKRHFGPEVRGTLAVEQGAGAWRAEIAGRSAPVKVADDLITFELGDGKGSFRGRLAARRTAIIGHWTQPATIAGGTRYASPVVLTPAGRDLWRGEIRPLDDEMMLYLMVQVRDDGSAGASLRNPERNAGRFLGVDRVERTGSAIRLLGQQQGGANGRLVAEGVYRDGTLSIAFPTLGGTFDFRRVKVDGPSDFYPRGRPTAAYVYTPPRPGDDGWPTASLADVRLAPDAVHRFVQRLIDTPIDSVGASEIHGVLIARHGKLVLEEYFHGEHRDKPHDTRSASKSLTSILVGAAIHRSVPLDVSTPVYKVMNGGAFPPSLEPRKRALTVEHLLTMSSGLDCDDANSSSPGNEDVMQEQTAQPDWYRYTLDLPTVREPGTKAVYGSANPNLLGGVLSRAAGRPLPELFQEFVAEPLEIKRYAMNLTPTGDAYMGGGLRLLPRDFLKLGQLVLNGGRWKDRRVLSAEWCRRATAPRYELAGIHYGYLWWVIDYPYKGRTVRAFFAGGNGGQIAMAIPELDLVLAFYGGNYGDAVSLVPQRVYVPQHILPAVEESG
jgi:CubicO group peptidase (beta-lactamase class C family)